MSGALDGRDVESPESELVAGSGGLDGRGGGPDELTKGRSEHNAGVWSTLRAEMRVCKEEAGGVLR